MVEFETIVKSLPIFVFYDSSKDLYFLVIFNNSSEFKMYITREEARDLSKFLEMR